MTIKNNTTELITTFHSESTVHSNDINISYCEKTPKIDEKPKLSVSSKLFFSILTVLKTLNNLIQKTHYLELNRISTNDFVIAIKVDEIF